MARESAGSPSPRTELSISGAEDGRIIRWSFDLRAARAQICATAGRELTRQEWATHIPLRAVRPFLRPTAESLTELRKRRKECPTLFVRRRRPVGQPRAEPA